MEEQKRCRFETHSHTMYSNIRLLDSINKPKELVDRAIELGLTGIAITEHECLANHIELNMYQKQIQEMYPGFKIALGNEIYLTPNRENGQRYYHFILIAKNKEGHRALRELSSTAWMNSYWDRGLERVPTTYEDLEKVLQKYPHSLIATTACLGGELSANTLNLINAEKVGDTKSAETAHNNIVNFMLWCQKIFGEDFYIECAPGCSRDQIEVNKRLASISKAFNVKMVVGSDAHYLKKEDRYVHKAYLNSKGGEREVDEFYEFTYLQSNEEIIAHLRESGYNDDFTKQMFQNSDEICEKIELYSLEHKQTIPKVAVDNYEKKVDACLSQKYPILDSMLQSDDEVERYWVNKCLNKLVDLGKNNDIYWSRLEEEADIKRTISEKLETNMFAYPVTLQHYVDLFWECGSMVGAGRGSSCSGLNHYLLGITQLDPIEWELPFWRYLNKERVELGDIDLDLCPSKRPIILKRIKEERGQNFKKDIDELSRKNLGCTLIATFGTEGTRSTILTACRGYRAQGFPDGIDVDTAQYLSSLIPSERGFLWPLKDCVEGNPEKDRKPIQMFINEVNQYPGLLEIMMGIEGLVNKRSSHASGVILFDEDPYEFGCFMRTPKGEIITQYDLHMCEAAGMTKYDFLVTEVQDKLTEAIKLLQDYGEVDSDLTLRQVYDKYFHPNVLPTDRADIWKTLQENSVLNIFQFDSEVGSQAAKKIKPQSMMEMADANGLMRLMATEKGAESPMEKYIRYKENINLWYKEMDEYGLTKEEQKYLEPYFKSSYGVPPSQEQLMKMLMDEHLCNFSLKDANAARKIVGKKQMSKIPALRQQVLDQAASPCLGNYIWTCGIGPQMGYSFSIIHALAYSFIGFQTMFIATNWNPIYWNTACLIVNSGSLEEEEEFEEDEETGEVEKKKEKATDYGKIAKAIGDIISKGIRVSLVDINKSSYSFVPDPDSNEILFGMKALSNVGGPVIEQIIKGRPYYGIADFMNRCPLNKSAMISLIKAGAFDRLEKDWAKESKLEPRMLVMMYYISKVCEAKKRITLQNFNGLVEHNLIPEELDLQKRVYNFTKYLKANKKVGKYYVFDNVCEDFYNKHFDMDQLEVINGLTCIQQTKWDKIYQTTMDKVRDWIKDNHDEILQTYNDLLFKETWDKYAQGSISAYEMEALCFYYHDHELKNVKVNKYGIVDFNELNSEPDVDYFFKRNGHDIPIYKINKIIGTVIGKNDARSSVSLLTTTGVVNVKFTKEYFAMYNRQLSEKQEDGTKKVMEKGWFTRGVKLLVSGFRRDDTFVAKTYKNNGFHQLYKITDIKNNGEIELVHDRAGMESENGE
jgi:DNA polymerase-3 subunit alpha